MKSKFTLHRWVGILTLSIVLISIILFLLYTSESPSWGGGYWEHWVVRHLHWNRRFVHDLVFWVRKGCHFLGYGGIGLLNWAYFAQWGLKKPLPVGLGLTILIAVMDEYAQSFTTFRSGKPEDVLIDVCGAVVITGAVFMRIRSNKPSSSD